jgi:hypothetical protein
VIGQQPGSIGAFVVYHDHFLTAGNFPVENRAGFEQEILNVDRLLEGGQHK